MNRRNFLTILGGTMIVAHKVGSNTTTFAQTDATRGALAQAASRFELEEATIAELQQGLQSGRFTARSLTEIYLRRIAEVDQSGVRLNSVLETNPDALSIADELDRERKARGARSALHGVPILIKDNIDTADRMETTAGSLALLGATKPARDAFIVERLRRAGAVLLGKTNLSEWANFRSTRSSSGWSGRGGQTNNPYALDRNPCGSSSGSGASVAANLCLAAIGTETDGSIVCPSSANGIVGIKPTVGLLSRSGIIPISHTQDTPGPMARTVRDAAIILGALTGIDPRDRVTNESLGKSHTDYTRFLNADGLRGARLGVARKYTGYNEDVDKLFEDAIAEMKRRGAIIIDKADLPTAGKFGDSEFEVLLYEFKSDLNDYLRERKVASPVGTLEGLIAFNERQRAREMPYFEQEIFKMAQKKNPLTDRKYLAALRKNRLLTRAQGIDFIMNKHRLDAMIAPTGSAAWTTDLINGDHFSGASSQPAAVAGYPNVTVPMGDIYGLPVGVSFFGRAYSEPVLIKLAYAYEQATKHRKPPTLQTTVVTRTT